MQPLGRRKFLEGIAFSGAAASFSTVTFPENPLDGSQTLDQDPAEGKIDFRYAPRLRQATICFPDDSKKSLVGERGDLRYDFSQESSVGVEDFGTVCRFSLAGMQDDHVVRQWLEAPGIPIVHTLIERPAATLEVVAFATRHGKEGRVDNVVMTILPKQEAVTVVPRIEIHSNVAFKLSSETPIVVVEKGDKTSPFLAAQALHSPQGSAVWWPEGWGYTLYLPHGEASRSNPMRYLIRLPQEGQSLETIQDMLQSGELLMEEARKYWADWQAFEGVRWSYPGKHGEFLTACARNIQQAREVKNESLVFETGPTLYRDLWIVDGHFLLEAARYLGYDKDADNGLLSEWNKQLSTGQIVAASGGEHWKDTSIAMFTLVRQCELKQDWGFFRELEPNVLRAVNFLVQLRDQARSDDSVNGRYGILPPGFADGGIGGVRSEFTNTVWSLAGLKAVAEAAERLHMESLNAARTFYEELRSSFLHAAKAEMAVHPAGFKYLPMVSLEDPAWHDLDPWNRPRPQTAQWALSHAIFPGLVFDKEDPIVRGHIALMQACTQEDVPAETGWLWHEAVWTYNASFVAHVYLWGGLGEWAERTFGGFLNHASPLYCWREEQPLQHALVSQDWGDMPHNWASAECVRYLRHRLVLEDGGRLRLLAGVVSRPSHQATHFLLENSPTRFGRVTLTLEPLDQKRGWKLEVASDMVQAPEAIEIPRAIGGLSFDRLVGARYRLLDAGVTIDPQARKWTAIWR